jgi:UDP-N-acetylmuramoyl-tripeptide--D-alanyl-D-alanine ligase
VSRPPIRLTALDIAGACGGRLVDGDGRLVIDGFSIDTRTLARGDLFFAIRGGRFDGHRFVREALDRGAAGAVIEDVSAWPAGGGRTAILVEDTVLALQNLASRVRRDSGATVVAVTGSAGKTTTKEATAELLSATYRVFRNKGNLNNHIGLPLSLLELRRVPEVAVVELGMNHPGEIRTLVRIARPDIRVWTNVGDAHLGFFGSSDAIADAKAEVLEEATPETVLVANADDPRVMSRAARFPGRIVTFGIERDATVRAVDVEDRGVDGMGARLRTPAGEARLMTPLLGRGNLANVLAASAVALHLSVPLDDVIARAARLRPAPHRGEVVRLGNGVTIIDDSYNSSPTALTRVLDVVRRADGFARRAAVLGEMLELGDHAVRLHSACGATAGQSNLSWLISVGGAPAAALANAARQSGMDAQSVLHVGNSAEAATLAASRVAPGDLLLVKGSRGVGTDRVVDRLKEAAA